VPTMAFLEFLLSGFESASKRRAPASPTFCRGVGPPNLPGLVMGLICAGSVARGRICAVRSPWVPNCRRPSGPLQAQLLRQSRRLALLPRNALSAHSQSSIATMLRLRADKRARRRAD
jgi:hypothetical protein